MADLQFHSNHCYIAESTRATAEENRPQQDRESEEGASGEFGDGEHFTGMSLVCVCMCVYVWGGCWQQSQWAECEQWCKCEKGGDEAVEKMDWKQFSLISAITEGGVGLVCASQTAARGLYENMFTGSKEVGEHRGNKAESTAPTHRTSFATRQSISENLTYSGLHNMQVMQLVFLGLQERWGLCYAL